MEVQSERVASQANNHEVKIPAHDATKGSNSCQRRLAALACKAAITMVVTNSLSLNSLSIRLPLGSDHWYGA